MPKLPPAGDEEIQFVQARAAAYRLLAIRRRTCREVSERLLQKGFATGVAEKTVLFLREYSLLDDLAYARAWVDQRSVKNGAARLRKDLLAKGIDPEIIGRVLGEMDEEAEYRHALDLARKRLARHGKNYPLPRLSRLLQRHGFSIEIIGRVCRSLGDGALCP